MGDLGVMPMTMMYWHIGERINREVLGNERAEYGKQIVSQVATQLQKEYGRKGFEPCSIWRMMQFAKLFPDSQIVAQLARKLLRTLEIVNPNFKGVEFDPLLAEAGSKAFTMRAGSC